jgi:hypothetical protein
MLNETTANGNNKNIGIGTFNNGPEGQLHGKETYYETATLFTF